MHTCHHAYCQAQIKPIPKPHQHFIEVSPNFNWFLIEFSFMPFICSLLKRDMDNYCFNLCLIIIGIVTSITFSLCCNCSICWSFTLLSSALAEHLFHKIIVFSTASFLVPKHFSVLSNTSSTFATSCSVVGRLDGMSCRQFFESWTNGCDAPLGSWISSCLK